MSPTAFGVLLVVVSTMVEGFGQTFLKKSALDVTRRSYWILLGVARADRRGRALFGRAALSLREHGVSRSPA